jgi:hypothetical protein
VSCVADVASAVVKDAEAKGAGGRRDTGAAETLHAVSLAHKLGVPETRLLEDAKALVRVATERRAANDLGEKDDEDDEFGMISTRNSRRRSRRTSGSTPRKRKTDRRRPGPSRTSRSSNE